jgi:hypothetical protein
LLVFSGRLSAARLRTARSLFQFGVAPESAEFGSDLIRFFDEDLGGFVYTDNPGGLTRSVYRRFVDSQS